MIPLLVDDVTTFCMIKETLFKKTATEPNTVLISEVMSNCC